MTAREQEEDVKEKGKKRRWRWRWTRRKQQEKFLRICNLSLSFSLVLLTSLCQCYNWTTTGYYAWTNFFLDLNRSESVKGQSLCRACLSFLIDWTRRKANKKRRTICLELVLSIYLSIYLIGLPHMFSPFSFFSFPSDSNDDDDDYEIADQIEKNVDWTCSDIRWLISQSRPVDYKKVSDGFQMWFDDNFIYSKLAWLSLSLPFHTPLSPSLFYIIRSKK